MKIYLPILYTTYSHGPGYMMGVFSSLELAKKAVVKENWVKNKHQFSENLRFADGRGQILELEIDRFERIDI